jgi:hypothetical protein
MRQGFKPRQVQESARTLDGVDEAEDVIEDIFVVGVLLKADQLDVDDVETLVRLGHKIAQQIVHTQTLSWPEPILAQPPHSDR